MVFAVRIVIATHFRIGKNPETKAFAEEYSAQIVDDHNELAFLSKEDESLDIDQGEDEHGQDQDQEEDDDERDVVTTDRLRAELQRAAREAEEADVSPPTTVHIYSTHNAP